MNNHPIVIFDGICNYCNALVNFAIRNDKKKNLKFVAAQTEKGQALLAKFQLPEVPESAILIEGDVVYTNSTAAIRICKYFSGFFRLAYYSTIIIPKFIRDPVYKFIAKRRYRLFGKTDSCMVPTQEVRERFL